MSELPVTNKRAASDDVEPGWLVPAELRDRTDYLFCKVSETIKRRADEMLAPLGLRGSHHAVLRVLAACGPMPQQDVATRLYVDPSTIVDLVDHLEDDDLVSRRRNPRDRRAYLLDLTDAGRARLEAADISAQEMQERFFSALPEAEYLQLRSLLGTLATLPGPGGGPAPLTGEYGEGTPVAVRRRRRTKN